MHLVFGNHHFEPIQRMISCDLENGKNQGKVEVKDLHKGGQGRVPYFHTSPFQGTYIV